MTDRHVDCVYRKKLCGLPHSFFAVLRLSGIVASALFHAVGDVVLVERLGVISESGFQVRVVVCIADIVEGVVNGVDAPILIDAVSDIMVVKRFDIITEGGFQISVLVRITDVVEVGGADCDPGGGSVGMPALLEAVGDIMVVKGLGIVAESGLQVRIVVGIAHMVEIGAGQVGYGGTAGHGVVPGGRSDQDAVTDAQGTCLEIVQIVVDGTCGPGGGIQMVHRADGADGGRHGVCRVYVQLIDVFVEVAEHGVVHIGIGDGGIDGAGCAAQQVALIDVSAVDDDEGLGAGDRQVAQTGAAQVQRGDYGGVVIYHHQIACLQLLAQIVQFPVVRLVVKGGRIGLVAPFSALGHVLDRVGDGALGRGLQGTEPGHADQDGGYGQQGDKFSHLLDKLHRKSSFSSPGPSGGPRRCIYS